MAAPCASPAPDASRICTDGAHSRHWRTDSPPCCSGRCTPSISDVLISVASFPAPRSFEHLLCVTFGNERFPNQFLCKQLFAGTALPAGKVLINALVKMDVHYPSPIIQLSADRGRIVSEYWLDSAANSVTQRDADQGASAKSMWPGRTTATTWPRFDHLLCIVSTWNESIASVVRGNWRVWSA